MKFFLILNYHLLIIQIKNNNGSKKLNDLMSKAFEFKSTLRQGVYEGKITVY